MCWEGGWEWARLSVALDVKELDSYSLLIYTPGWGGQHAKQAPLPLFSHSRLRILIKSL